VGQKEGLEEGINLEVPLNTKRVFPDAWETSLREKKKRGPDVEGKGKGRGYGDARLKQVSGKGAMERGGGGICLLWFQAFYHGVFFFLWGTLSKFRFLAQVRKNLAGWTGGGGPAGRGAGLNEGDLVAGELFGGI